MEEEKGREQILPEPISISPGQTGQTAIPIKIEGPVNFGRPESLDPSENAAVAFYVGIKNHCEAISFNHYKDFMSRIMCPTGEVDVSKSCAEEDPDIKELKKLKKISRSSAPFHSVNAFNLLKLATEVFLLLRCGVIVDKNVKDAQGEIVGLDQLRLGKLFTIDQLKDFLTAKGGLPYLEQIVNALFPDYKGQADEIQKSPFCNGILQNRFTCPCLLELIWSYWHEEGMLAQTMNAISLRFQNRRGPDRDPIANLEIDPLRPLSNLLWGYIQDEQHRLTVVRRAYEYDHHYGLKLYGKAIPELRSADSRSKFLEAFHSLLNRCAAFFKEESNTMIIPDGFPLLNALKELHLILAEGAHNQFGDLPWTARVEMLMQQWLLARPEMRDFLGSRIMVPYREDWMGRVDAMKKMQGWPDTTVTHFRDLGVFGEQLFLSIRYHNWGDIDNQTGAKNWAHYWKPEIQGYIHAYRAVTGVDLSAVTASNKVDATLPSEHLRKRLAMQLQGK